MLNHWKDAINLWTKLTRLQAPSNRGVVVINVVEVHVIDRGGWCLLVPNTQKMLVSKCS
jgi:hypothetical protein